MFFSMLKLWFFRLLRGWKGTKLPKMAKISVCHTLYFRNHISYDLHLWYTCMYKMIISPGIFFIFFFKTLIFRIIRDVGRGVEKGQNMAHNDKKSCLSHSVSQEPYIRYHCFWYTCKMMMAPANFFIFQNFDLWVFSGGERQKMT